MVSLNGVNKVKANRILYLDGLRCIAILMVIFYHWHMNHKDYDARIFSTIFKFGFLGVQLFFIVSGFVIAMTLHKCDTIGVFAIKRFARLWPAMFLCSIVTFVIYNLSVGNDGAKAKSYLDFIPSLTFVDPDLYTKIFSLFHIDHKFNWMDGSYWSLWVEVRFYALAAIIYFANKVKFEKNMLIFGTIVLPLYVFAHAVNIHGMYAFLGYFFVAESLPWFLIGVSFYMMHNERKDFVAMALLVVGLVSALLAIFTSRYAHYVDMNQRTMQAIASLSVVLIFFLASQWSVFNRFLSVRAMAIIGAASYSLYLIHQIVGGVLLRYFVNKYHLSGGNISWTAIGITLAEILFAYLVYRTWELPLNKLFISYLVRPAPSTTIKK